jgi:hypothetical protein
MSSSPGKLTATLPIIEELKENRRSTRRSSASSMNSSFDNETVSMGKTHETHDDNEEISALRDQLSARDREISFLQEKLSEVDLDNYIYVNKYIYTYRYI